MGITKFLRKLAIPASAILLVLTTLPKIAHGYELPRVSPAAKITQITPERKVELEQSGTKIEAKLAGIEPLKDTSDMCIEEKVLTDTRELLEDVSVTTTEAISPLTGTTKSVYLFLPDGKLLNTELVALGLARKQTSPLFPTKYDKELEAAEKMAMEQKIGLWAEECTPDETELTLVSPVESENPLPTEAIIEATIDQAVPLKDHIEIAEIIPTTTPSTSLRINPLPIILEPVSPATPSTETVVRSEKPVELAATSHDSERIFAAINAHRAKIGKPAFLKDERICSVAQSRGPELYDEIFVNRNMHAGFFARNLPYWATENVASYQTEDQIMGFWLRSPVHRSAIEGDYTHSCGACYGNSCAQIFTNFSPKTISTKI